MYLKAINLKGFKSFPDRTRLTFTPGVSVIVGPNGSGKSNITDAVLWALGEQSPQAVRGSAMKDVIFAGGQGQSRRRFAEVEVVIDNSEGRAASEFSEISITRRIERDGDGEYRLNGARCRLADILEVLSDTNMGREMHSVISQGKVEAIVGSKPKDRRMLIEEAAGLGKHRKRRHRAALKLQRTRENLDRALDVEREARSRLRPLKRQAEAAERTAKLLAQEDELRATLVASELRSQQDQLSAADKNLIEIRGKRDAVEGKLGEVRERRAAIEERVASGEDERRREAQRLAEAGAAVERVRARAEAVGAAERELRSGLGERQLRLTELDDEPEAEAATTARIAELEKELEALQSAGGGADLELEELREAAVAAEAARAEAEAKMPALGEAAAKLARATQARDMARAEAEKAAQRRASLQGELAAVEAKLAGAAMEGSDEVLAGMIETGTGVERALSAALGERLRAAVVASVPDGVQTLEDSEGASRALVAGAGSAPGGPQPEPPVEGARRLLDLVAAEGHAKEVADRLLADAWLVDDLATLPPDFRGIAVTVDGDAYDGAAGELRRLPREGTDPALAARSQREELASRLTQREQTLERAGRDLERAEEAQAVAQKERDETDFALREARRALDEATEEARRTTWLAERRAERADDGGPTTVKRAQLEAELAAERRHAEAAKAAGEARRRDQERLRRRIALEEETLPALAATREALLGVLEVLERRAAAMGAGGGDEGGGEVAAELRECSKQEFELQSEMRGVSEALTAAEVEAAQLRDRRDESHAELQRLSRSLDRELSAAESPLPDAEAEEIRVKLERLGRRREQIGPVNPLAEREYAEAAEHVRELTEQRKDMEQALTEIKALIRRTDREISQAFEETFEATARNFEEMVAELFPGGRGKLRRIELSPRAVPDQNGEAPAEGSEEAEDDEALEHDASKDEAWGVEIEVTPAGKSTRRLSLLSGGEKSLVALAFVFAVLMARPCPFYILDEVEAALDDINIDRFLRLVRRFSERSQFIVVTHQKRTMDAADILYGVSMGGDGVTKVVSRRLPRDGELAPGDVPEADAAAAEAEAA
jgi:chromosome segregation protein